MIRIPLTAILFFASAYATAQETKAMVSAHVGAANNFSFATSSDPALGRIKPWNLTPSIGVEMWYSPFKHWKASIGLKYYTRTQKLVQENFNGYFLDESYTYMRYKYENIEIPLMAWGQIRPRLWGGIGLSFNNYNLIMKNFGHHLAGVGGGPKAGTNSYLGIHYEYAEQPLGRWFSQTSLLAGLQGKIFRHKLPRLSVGMLVTFRLDEMPQYQYTQVLTTHDQGTITKVISYQSHQHTIELQLKYDIFRIYHKAKEQG